jgi:hypothetical protein
MAVFKTKEAYIWLYLRQNRPTYAVFKAKQAYMLLYFSSLKQNSGQSEPRKQQTCRCNRISLDKP